LLVVDRADHPDVSASVRRWLVQYPGLRALNIHPRIAGTAVVLRLDGTGDRRWSWRVTAQTVRAFVRTAPRRWTFDLRLRLARSAEAAQRAVQ
jgi:hypothetical protein